MMYSINRIFFNVILSMSLLLTLILANVYAQPQLEITLDKDVLYPGEEVYGTIKINNTGGRELEVYIDIYALGRESWFSWKRKSFNISDEIKEETFSIGIPEKVDGGIYYFYVYLKDTQNDNVITSLKKAFTILERPLLIIDKVNFKYPDINSNETQTIYITLKNIGELNAEKYMLKIKIPKAGYLNTIKEIALEKGETEIRYVDIYLPPSQPPGMYEVEVELYDDFGRVIDFKKASFRVKNTPLVKEEISVRENIFYKVSEYNVENIGNVPYTYRLEIDSNGFIWIYEFEGKEPKKINGKYYIECNLNLGEKCGFTVKINYWILYVVVLVIITLVILLFISFTSPKIKKEYYKKGHKYHVSLTIANHKRTEIKECIVRDYVKGIFKIDESSFLPKPSKIYKKKDHYIIEWKLGSLKPGEMRVLRYDLIPKITIIGEIALDKAEFEGKTSKGGKIRKTS